MPHSTRQYQKVPDITRVPEGTRQYQRVSDNTRRYQTLTEYQKVLDSTREYQTVPDSTRQYQTVPEGTRRLSQRKERRESINCARRRVNQAGRESRPRTAPSCGDSINGDFFIHRSGAVRPARQVNTERAVRLGQSETWSRTQPVPNNKQIFFYGVPQPLPRVLPSLFPGSLPLFLSVYSVQHLVPRVP